MCAERKRPKYFLYNFNKFSRIPNSVAFAAYYIKVIEDTPTHSASEMYSTKDLVLAVYHL